MNKDLRDKLKTISFILVLFVVLTHSNNSTINYSSETIIIKKGINWFIQNSISEGFAKVASPLFFSISGFLFFLSIKDGSLKEYPAKYKKRFRTLVIPYLLWSIYGVILFFVLQSLPFSKPFFTHQLIADLSFLELFNIILLNPIPYHLWYVETLVILVILSPILYWLISNFKLYILFAFLIIWLLNTDDEMYIARALFFFSLGSYFSIKKINLSDLKSNNTYLAVVSWIILVLFKTYLNFIEFDGDRTINFIHKSSIILGIISIWLIYDEFSKKRDLSQTRIYSFFQYSFFLFAFHEPTLTIIKKGLIFIFGKFEFGPLAAYISAPILTVTISLLIGIYLKKTVPKFYYVITGGR